MVKITLFFATIFGCAALLIWGTTSYLAIDDLAKCDAPDPRVAACAPAEAIVAVSGGDTPARTDEAIKLYLDGWAPILVFSGAALDTTGPSNAEAMKRQALAAGVPESAILLDSDSMDTAQNASRTFSLLADKRRIILVTSPYHQHRASLEFEHVFGQGVEIIDHPTPTDRMWPETWYLTANGWWLAVSETVKTFIVSL
jgi:uncharacterized SAM-binding protein YcdF (DUF218 family)